MDLTWSGSQRAFAQAARWFVATVPRARGRWDEPGLGEWDVRSLVGHTSRSLLTVESSLATPAAQVDVASPGGYLRATRAIAAGGEVTDRGRAAGVALGEDPAAAVAVIAERVLALVAEQDGTALVTTIVGGMRLSDYLPTRVFELVVHTCDLARALGVRADVPPEPAAHALAVVAETAAAAGAAGDLLLAATGRTRLPEGFSIL